MDTKELRDRVAKIRPDLPTGLVIDCLLDNYTGPHTRYSIDDIAKATHLEQKTVFTVMLLLSGPPTYALRAQWIFFSSNGQEYSIDEKEFEGVLREWKFVHPGTGQYVDNFEEKIYLVHYPDKFEPEPVT